MLTKKAIVVHSGGMDSSLCLAAALKEFGTDQVLSVSFSYHQRHTIELERAAMICKDWGVDHIVLNIDCLAEITQNALTDASLEIEHVKGETPNTLVVGRNGLMARLAAIHAESLGVDCIYMGIIEVESANSGYRDCTRAYMDLMEQILRIDFDNPKFNILTPLVKMTKKETMEFGDQQGVLAYLLEHTVTCYEGIPQIGCQKCPACLLRNEGIREFSAAYPDFILPYQV
jgi:7-cyano-7-deazaguanine synthase